MENKPIVFAHRGFSGLYPENTLLAFKKALELGVTGIELDVQLTKDGHIVVIHDEKLERTTNGHGLVVQYTLAELRELDAGSWFSPHQEGLVIPTLEEVLELIENYPIILNIELKTGIVDYPALEEKVLAMVKEFDLADRVLYSSFNHYSIKKIKDLDATARTGVLYMEGIYEPWDYARWINADALHPLFYVVRPELIAGAHAAGIDVNTFTLDDETLMRRMIQCGVDGIFTNYPDRLLKILNEQ